jgi:Spy/CpxP family protein refolding chaperone
MSKPAWIAIIAAIAFPSIAVIVVLLAGPPRPPPPMGPPGGPPRAGDWLPPAKGPPPIPDEVLLRLRPQLGLTDDQIERIHKIGDPAQAHMAELDEQLRAKEQELRRALEQHEGENVDEGVVNARLEEISALRLEMDKVMVLTPLRLRAVLTPEQRSKLVELWRDQGPDKMHSFGGPHGPGGPPPMPLDDPLAPPPPPPPPDRPPIAP